jgi:acyl-CoA thioester hydrolase
VTVTCPESTIYANRAKIPSQLLLGTVLVSPLMTEVVASKYAITITVADADIDALGHASNIAYVRWIQDVAIAHSDAVGLTFDAYKKLGGVFFVRRHEIDYMRPVLRGDRLEVRTWIDSAMAAKCKRGTEIVLKDGSGSESGTVALKSMTTWGFVEIATGRPIRIPESIRMAFGMPRASVVPPQQAD